jgi:hypothetical protein
MTEMDLMTLEIMTVGDGGETRMVMRVTVGIQSSEK